MSSLSENRMSHNVFGKEKRRVRTTGAIHLFNALNEACHLTIEDGRKLFLKIPITFVCSFASFTLFAGFGVLDLQTESCRLVQCRFPTSFSFFLVIQAVVKLQKRYD